MKLFKRKKLINDIRMPRRTGNARVFSYYNSRQDSAGDRRPVGKPSRKRINFKMIPTFTAVVLVIVSGLYLLWIDTNPRVQIVGSTEPAILRSIETYHDEAQTIINSSILNRTKITMNTRIIEQALKKRFPELKEVAITIPLAGHRPIVELQAVTPQFIIAAASSGAFIIDESGRAVVSTKDAAPELRSLSVITDESGVELKAGKGVLPVETAKFISSVMGQFAAKSYKVSSLTLPAVVNELRVTPEGKGYYVKFNTAGDARLQAGMYFALAEKLEANKKKPAEYIDVRVDEKAFYK